MKKLAILYFSDYRTWPAGGMLQYLINIIPKLNENYSVTIFGCSIDGEKPKDIQVDGKTYEITIIGNIKTKNKIIPNYLRYFYYMKKNSKKIHDMKFDVLYFHASPLFYAYKKTVKKEKAILAYHQHGLSCKNKIFSFFQNYSMKNSDICFINAGLEDIEKKEKELKVKNNSLIRAPGQVNLQMFRKYTDKDKNSYPCFCYSGRITEWKQPLLLINAMKYVKDKKYPKAKLVLIGDGDQRSNVESLAKKLGIENDVEITGFISFSDVSKYLNKADVFAMPTKGEGNSLSVIEAMACHLPVVCFDVIGMKDLISSNYNGCIAKSMTYESFGDAMILAYEKAEVLGKNARKIAEDYSIEKITATIVDSLINYGKNKNGNFK